MRGLEAAGNRMGDTKNVKDSPKGKDPSRDDDLHEVDQFYAEIDKKRRTRQVIAIVVSVLIVVGVIFGQSLFDLIKQPVKQHSRQVEKEAKETKNLLSAEEWNPIAANVKTLLDEGRLDEAQNHLIKVLESNPDIAEANYLAGTIYLRQGRVQSAYGKLRQAIALRPDYYEAQEKLGEIYLLAGDYKAAKDVAAKLVQGKDYLQDGLLMEAEIAMSQGNIDEALRKADTAAAVAREKGKVKMSSFLADLYLKKGDKEKADKIVRNLDTASMNAEGLLSLAKYHLGADQDAQALSLFKQALKRYPESAEVNYHYGQYLFKKGQYGEAGLYYKKALSVVPSIQIVAYQYAQCLLATNQYNEANAYIDDMDRKHPNSLLTLGLKLQYHLLIDERRQAIDTVKRITRIIPYAPRPYTILANLYWQEGMMPLAEKNARKAISLKDKTVLPHLMVGDVLFAQKRFPEALAYYDRVLEVQPDNLVALLQTGDLYLATGQPRKAEEQYAKALTANPRLKSIQTKIAWAKAQGGDMNSALAMNRQYLREVPNDSQAVTAYANLLLAAGRVDEALDTVQKSLKKQPKAWPLHYLMGDLYTIKKDFKSAKTSYDTAIALNPDDVKLALNVGARFEENALDSETEHYYNNVVKRFPNNPLVANQLAWFYIERMGMPQKAKTLVESLLSEREWPEISDTVGWYYYSVGQYASAENYFRQALLLMPNHHNTRARLALALYALKKDQEASSEAQKILTVMTSGPLKNRLENAMVQAQAKK